MEQNALSTYYAYYKKQKYCKYIIYILVFSLLGLSAFILLTPNFALAGIFEDIGGTITRTLFDMTNGLYQGMWKNIQHMMDGGLLTSDFNSLFGNNSASTKIYNIVTTTCDTVVKPIAGSILALVFLLQFIKMAGKADSNGTIPMFKEILVMFTMFVLFEFAVSHADDICAGIYSLFTQIAKGITHVDQQGFTIKDFIVSSPNTSWDDNNYMASLDAGPCLYFIATFIVGGAATFIASIVATVMCYARAIQLYAYTTFAPIPLSMLGFEETRSWGVGFFKNFASVALAGVILVFILFIFPTALTAVMGGDQMSVQLETDFFKRDAEKSVIDCFLDGAAGIGSTTGAFFRCLGFIICFIIAIVKSGGWAKDILGS